LLEEAHFHIAIILNITKDHLDRYHTMENYIRAKKNICRYQAQQDAVVINIDNEITKQIYSELQAEGKIGNIIPISTQRIVEKGVSVIGHTLYNNRGQQLELGELLYLKGKHNAENIAASFAACQIYGLQAEQIIQAMQTYPGLEHRMQHIDKVGKITFVNDSKATNAEAAQHALQAFDNIYWIAGGVAKEGGITSLTSCFNNINHAFLIGAAQEEYALVLQQAGINYTKCGDLASAFEAATRLACQEPVQDAVVLLSPACASYDQWENFEQRGQAFCNLVHKYKHKMQERTLQHS
jgi:UDP-N-acetylmuramoylalanine--D-glutamate ligase